MKIRAVINDVTKTIYDKNLKDKVSSIISYCDSKPSGWLKKCIK